MPFAQLSGVAMKGVSAVVPRHTVSNYELDFLTEKEKQLLVKTTGIEKRRIVADPSVCTSDLCYTAAGKLLEQLNWQPQDIDVLLMVTQTPDYKAPSTAILLQDRLGLPKTAMAFDINLGCSGYTYGLWTLASLLKSIKGGKGLLLAGDVSSNTISPKDKSTIPIFSDAGSATALQQSDDSSAPIHFTSGTDGSGYQAIIIPEGGGRHPLTPESLQYKRVQEGIERRGIDMVMNGLDVFNFSVSEVPQQIKSLLQHTGTTVDDVDHFVFHQANKVINEAIRKKVGIPPEKLPYSLTEYGNTSSATIPLTLVHKLGRQAAAERLTLVLSGFGVGLSWSSLLLTTHQLTCPPVIEH